MIAFDKLEPVNGLHFSRKMHQTIDFGKTFHVYFVEPLVNDLINHFNYTTQLHEICKTY